MRLETCRKHSIDSSDDIQTWYMKHVFKGIRCNWRCMSFARARRRTYQSQQRMARKISFQKAQSRAEASRPSQSPVRSTSHRWMCKSFSALYSHSHQRFRTRDKLSKLKNRILGSESFHQQDPSSSSSLAELIPRADYDLVNVAVSSTDSDEQPAGVPPSRRSSGSLLSNYRESSTAPSPAPARSPFSALRHNRRRRSVLRAAKVALSGHGISNGWERSAEDSRVTGSVGIGRSKYTHGLGAMRDNLEATTRTLPTPENLSRGTSMTMDTSSSPYKSPTKSISPRWQDSNYDAETLSVSSWGTSMRADPYILDARRSTDRRPSVSRSVASGAAYGRDKHKWLHRPDPVIRQDSAMKPKPDSRMAPPAWSGDLHRRQASAIKGAIHAIPGKDFQEAIVDIILENDVQDLVDLEEFLQDYFRLNSLYQDIIQQFFNDLSGDPLYAQVSRAPSVIARLASANRASNNRRNSASARKSTARRI